MKGTTIGTLTDIDGNFTLEKVAPNAVLTFSYVGYLSQDVVVTNKKIDIALQEETSLLKEFVAIGYGVQKKSDLTGSVSSVKGKDLQSIATGSVDQALIGKIAGVLVTPSSGSPGAGAVIRIRGTGTLNNSNPLYVIDGMLLDDINFLNPNDVESVEVLKDASATAIYGSRGANGVLIITTKKGEAGKKSSISLSSYYGQQSLMKQIPMTNGSEYVLLRNEAAKNQGLPVIPFPNPEKYGVGTNWADEIFRAGAPMQNVNLSARGGNEMMTYGISADYFKQDGILRGGDFQRLSLRLNNEYKLNKFIKLGHNISLIDQKNNNAQGIIYDAYYAAPIVAPRDSLGKFSNVNSTSGVGNPVASQYYNSFNKGNSFRTVGNFFIDLNLLKGLTFRSNFGLDLVNSEGRSFTPVFYVTDIQQSKESSLNANRNKSINKLWENTLNYNAAFGKHSFGLLAGMTSQSFDYYGLSGSGTKLLGDVNNVDKALDDLLFISKDVVQGARSIEESSTAWRMYSYLFRANYTFNEKYLLTASFRRDGSSLFGKDRRFGNFPSVALGWRVKQEDFLKDIDWLSNLKVRASWGIVGNGKIERIAGDTKSPKVQGGLDAVFGPTEQFRPGGTLLKLANPQWGWEETRQMDVGFEAGFLKNRLTAEIDWYQRNTYDVLIALPIPYYVGVEAPPVVNAARVLNTGFDVNLGWRDRLKSSLLGYHFNIIGSTVHNEVLALGQGKSELTGGDVGEGGKLGTRTVVGLPIGAFYGYKVAGIYQNAEQLKSLPKRANETAGTDVKVGDIAYADTDGDGVITTKDRTYLGSPIPTYTFAFNLGADWKGLDFSIQINGIGGNKIINSKRLARFSTGNFEQSFLNRWTGEGTSNLEPRVTIGGRNYEVSERFIEDGAFTAIRNLQVGYTLPLSIAHDLKMQNLRIYVAATNLKMWTKYSGYTPEIVNDSFDVLSVGIDRGVYPVAKTVSAGVSVTF